MATKGNVLIDDNDRIANATTYKAIGQYSDSTSQKPGTTGATSITFNTEDITEAGITHDTATNSEEFTMTESATYVWTLQPQWERTTSGAVQTIDFWAQVDTGGGFANIANSNIKEEVGNQESGVVTLVVTVVANANDKIRFQQKVSSTTDGLGLVTTAAASPVPATPSVILTAYAF